MSHQSATITLRYDNFSMNEILKKYLSNELYTEFPKSFEMIGTIAHVTLREKFLEYKKLIGNLILDVSSKSLLI